MSRAAVDSAAGPGRGAGPAPGHGPLEGVERTLGAIGLSLATFMNVLDSSIANVSIPAIAGDLGVSPSQGTWVITSYGVANAISLPLTGWLARRFGQVRLFIASVLLFVLASWLCGLAGSLQWLLACRVLQGAVAGPMIPLSQTLLLGSYPPERAGAALSLSSITVLVAPMVGPLLGGWVTDTLSWPWIFYINIPVGLLAVGLSWWVYRGRESPSARVPLDAFGLALLVVWVGAVQIVLDTGKEADWFASPFIVACSIIAAVGLVVFVVWELTAEHPVVDLTLFGRRSFWVGTLAIAVGYGTFFGNVVLLPLWLQQQLGYTATWAGLILAPVGLVAILLTPWVGRRIDRGDPRWLATVSFVTFALVFWARAQFDMHTDVWHLVLPTFLQGVAAAFFFIPLVSIVVSGLPPDRLPAAFGLSNFLRISAGAFGVSIATTAWEDGAAVHHARLVESVTPDNPAWGDTLTVLEATGLSREQALAVVARQVDLQAFTLSVNEVFMVSAVLSLALAAIVWVARPVRRPAPASVAGRGEPNRAQPARGQPARS